MIFISYYFYHQSKEDHLKKIQTALDKLFQYAANLLSPNPPRVWRTIKFATAFYHHHVKPVVGAKELLMDLGYSKDTGRTLEFEAEKPDIPKVTEITAELLVASMEIDNLVKYGPPQLDEGRCPETAEFPPHRAEDRDATMYRNLESMSSSPVPSRQPLSSPLSPPQQQPHSNAPGNPPIAKPRRNTSKSSGPTAGSTPAKGTDTDDDDDDDDNDDDQYPSSSARLSESQRIDHSKDVLDKLSLKDSYDSHVKSDGKSTVSSSEPGDVSTSQHHSTRSLSLVSVKEGSIMDYSVDAYVNSAHTSLNLSRGTLSQSLLTAGGSVMQAKCDKYVEANGPVRPGNIALISNVSTSLQCRFVIHIVGRGYDGVGGLAEQVLKSSVLKVLEECDRQNLSTVAFPALGSGNLGFPPDVAANIMFGTMASYLANTKTSLKKILVVVQDKSIYATFHRVFASSQNSAPASAPSVAPIQFSPHPNSLYSTVYKLLNIEIVRGDITKDDSEGIIACSSSQLLRPQGVMGALLAKGGKELQLECAAKVRMEGRLEQGKVMITRSGQPGGLLCRRILHIPIPDTPAVIQDSVYNALKMADRKGLASVSMPAIGTGGNHISPYQAARSLCTAIMSFSTCSALKLKRIRVVLITEQHTSVFFSTFSSMLRSGNLANDSRGSERSIPHLLSDHTSIGGVKSLSQKSKETSNVFGKEVTVNVPKFSDPGLCVTIITADQDAMKDVVKEVNTTIQEYCSEQTVKGGRELPPPVQAELKQHALKLSVELSFDETKGIILRGNKIDVAQLKSDIQARLHAIEQAKSRQKEAELFAVKLQWKWKDNQGILHSYDPLTNLAIEEAYLDQKEQCVIHVTTNEETREGIVDLKTMTEKGSREEYTIVRYKVESESMKHEDERPISWTPMPLDLNGKEEICHVVELLPGCDEYQVVAAEFHRTIGRAPVRRSYMPFPQYGISTVVSSSWEIAKIERIQNPTLYSQYMARKKEMEKSVDQGYEYERQLFHGCAKNAVESINHSGFNRSYAGLHATAYGKGVYFATEAQKSANDKYSTPDIGGVKRMYLAKVLVGEYTAGRSSMIQPPAKRESVLFNSVVDDTTNPSIFVILSDAQVYPEYLIHFRSSYY
jgi:poly [ADP-ribose] polymerase 10/14/15